MLYIGVDYSSYNTAITVLDNKGKLVFQYLIQPKYKLFDQRILKIKDELFKIIDNLNQPFYIVIETPSFFSKGKVIDVASGFGYLKYSILEKGYPLFWITPSELLKNVTGKGRLQKSKDKRLKYDELYELLPKEVKDNLESSSYKKWDDLIDSYWLAYILFKNEKLIKQYLSEKDNNGR